MSFTGASDAQNNESTMRGVIVDLHRRVLTIIDRYNDEDIQQIASQFNILEGMSMANERRQQTSATYGNNVVMADTNETPSIPGRRITRSASRASNHANNVDVNNTKLLASRQKLIGVCQQQINNGRPSESCQSTATSSKTFANNLDPSDCVLMARGYGLFGNRQGEYSVSNSFSI